MVSGVLCGQGVLGSLVWGRGVLYSEGDLGKWNNLPPPSSLLFELTVIHQAFKRRDMSVLFLKV